MKNRFRELFKNKPTPKAPHRQHSQKILDLFARQQLQSQAVQSAFDVTFERIQDYSQKSRQLSHQTQELNHINVQTTKLMSSIQASVQQVDSLKQEASATQKQMHTVLGFLTQIDDIAEQTNILSINAAIEAARAGEQGRAFQVVANHVGELSTESSQMAKAIRQNIQELASRIQNFEMQFQGFSEQLHHFDQQLTQQNQFFSQYSGKAQQAFDELIFLSEQTQQQVNQQKEAIKSDLESITKMVSDLIGELTQSRIQDVEVNWVREHLSHLKIIDVRRPEEFNDELGHIEGAQLATLDQELSTFLNQADPSLTYLFVCRSGGRSARAARIAQAMGFSCIYNLKGGMLTWRSQQQT